MATLDELESRLRSLLEVHLLKYLPGYKVEDGIVQQMAMAMQERLREQDGVTQAPNLYVVVAHPSTLARWRVKPRLLKEVANALYAAGSEAGFEFSTKPIVTTNADESLPADVVRVIASFSNESMAETHGTPVKAGPESNHEAIPSNAFFIIGGTQLVPLNRSVTNIGRRLDNHIVIDDPRVSRTHAQLRIVKNHFVIFDLNSSGGTFVNGQRTNQSVLYPGDVVSLAGVTLIFGQDLPNGRGTDDDHTEPGSSVSADRTTVIIHKEDQSQ